MRMTNFIPTRRPQDEAVKGVGIITSVQGNVLKAQGSNFSKTVGDKFQIWLNKSKKTVTVVRAIDNETVQIDNPEGVALENAQEDYSIIPKLDQKEVYDSSMTILRDGRVVGIFPEVA